MAVLTPFNPLFRDPFFREFDRLTTRRPNHPTPAPVMPVDVYRHGEEFVVRFDLPGIDPESVAVTVDQNVLSVAAERAWASEEGDRVLLAERPQGRFARRLRLGDNLDTDRIEAHYDRGVLTLTIPVTAEAQPRRIPVSTTTSATITTGDAPRPEGDDAVSADAPAPTEA
jgi:HSP20 family protein